MALTSDNSSGAMLTNYGVGSAGSAPPSGFQGIASYIFTPELYANQLDRYNAAITREFNAEQAAIARDFNASEAEKNRNFQEYMSNTSYQRAVADLKKAGLNPVMIAQHGGASTPSGSSASSGSASSGGVPSSRYGSQVLDMFKEMAARDREAIQLASGLLRPAPTYNNYNTKKFI